MFAFSKKKTIESCFVFVVCVVSMLRVMDMKDEFTFSLCFDLKLQAFPDFIRNVVNQLMVNMKRIHDLGVRKIGVMSLLSLGCTPQNTAASSFQRCNETENHLVLLHNNFLLKAVNTLNQQTNSTLFFIIDLHNAFWTVFNGSETIRGKPFIKFFTFILPV